MGFWRTARLTGPQSHQFPGNTVCFQFFFNENESTKAAKRKGSWAHQQIDKTTPSTIGSLSVVDFFLENPSCERIGMSMSDKVALWEGLKISLEALKPASCLLNQKHQHQILENNDLLCRTCSTVYIRLWAVVDSTEIYIPPPPPAQITSTGLCKEKHVLRNWVWLWTDASSRARGPIQTSPKPLHSQACQQWSRLAG